MVDQKQAVVNAYKDVAQSLTKASVALSNYAHQLEHTNDPALLASLVANPPALGFGAGAGVKPSVDNDSDTGSKAKRERKKKIKDLNAPKRPPSAYLEFQNAVRQKFRDEDPGLPYADVLRKISETWAKMNDDDKKHWNDITAQKNAEYEVAKANYKPAEGDIEVPAVPVTVGKDGKEYPGKKRGRKSAAEKAELEKQEDAGLMSALGHGDKVKKDKKVKGDSPLKGKAKAAPIPVAPASEDDSSEATSSSDSDDDSSDADSDDSEEDVPVVAPPKKSSKSKKQVEDKPSKAKKSKHA